MSNDQFDELAKRLATPISRRGAFKTMGAALAAGVLSRFGGGQTWAAGGNKGGNSACAHYCNAVCGVPDDSYCATYPMSAQCLCQSSCASSGAHCMNGTGPCDGICQACGPTSGITVCPSTSGGYCCPTSAVPNSTATACGPNNTCVATACSTGYVACGGMCVAGDCCSDTDCPTGEVCTANTCTAVTHPECIGATCGTFTQCSSSNSDCVCGSTAEGAGYCIPGSTPCGGLPACTTSADCSGDAVCFVNSCCGGGVCVSTSLTDQCPATSSGAAPVLYTPTRSTATGSTLGSR